MVKLTVYDKGNNCQKSLIAKVGGVCLTKDFCFVWHLCCNLNAFNFVLSSQVHQRFTHKFFVRKWIEQVSISSTFYAQIFCTKVNWAGVNFINVLREIFLDKSELSRCQFHQRFMRKFFVRKWIEQVSISSTFYTRVFHSKIESLFKANL